MVLSGPAEIKIILSEQADVSAAFSMPSKQQRGEYVFSTLVATAQKTQKPLLGILAVMGLKATPYYVANFILVTVPEGATISAGEWAFLSARTDVASLQKVSTFNTGLEAPVIRDAKSGTKGHGVESNIQFVHAPELWAQGLRGQGTTVGIIDSGVQWDHPLLREQYRGNKGNTVDHNFNWWDALHKTLAAGNNPCAVSSPAPCDDLGHGTHLAGVVAGGNGSDIQIGVAPQSQFIACRDMDRGYSSTGAAFEECLQFMLAPWDLNRENADPSKAPDILINPYHCDTTCTDDPAVSAAFWNLYAAGIVSVLPSEDKGEYCIPDFAADSTQAHGIAIVSGALDYNSASGAPIATIAGYSGAGLGSTQTMYKPSVAGPGTQIFSSTLGGNMGYLSGTSVAAAHLAGALALLISNESAGLKGKPEQIWRLVPGVSAMPVNACGLPGSLPNAVSGWGNLDVEAMFSLVNH